MVVHLPERLASNLPCVPRHSPEEAVTAQGQLEDVVFAVLNRRDGLLNEYPTLVGADPYAAAGGLTPRRRLEQWLSDPYRHERYGGAVLVFAAELPERMPDRQQRDLIAYQTCVESMLMATQGDGDRFAQISLPLLRQGELTEKGLVQERERQRMIRNDLITLCMADPRLHSFMMHDSSGDMAYSRSKYRRTANVWVASLTEYYGEEEFGQRLLTVYLGSGPGEDAVAEARRRLGIGQGPEDLWSYLAVNGQLFERSW